MSGASGDSDTNLKFTVTCGLLEITLTQEGESIKSISVSDNASTPNTYILSCGDGVSITSGAKFYIAVPEGTYTSFIFTNTADVNSPRKGLNISVSANHIKPVSSSFSPVYKEGSYSGLAIYVAGKWWAPVNCGYDATNYKYGKIYQFARAVGGGYNNDSTYKTETVYQIAETTASVPSTAAKTNPADTVFYINSEYGYHDWYTQDASKQLQLWPMKSGDDGYVKGKIANPCPSGWRVPTYDELNALLGGYSRSTTSGNLPTKDGQVGLYLNGTNNPAQDGTSQNSIFLPAAGARKFRDGTAISRGTVGAYWSSSVNSKVASHLGFAPTNAYMGTTGRAMGNSVRCVQD